jgi:hypothetical protein
MRERKTSYSFLFKHATTTTMQQLCDGDGTVFDICFRMFVYHQWYKRSRV